MNSDKAIIQIGATEYIHSNHTNEACNPSQKSLQHQDREGIRVYVNEHVALRAISWDLDEIRELGV
jgi:hypothetical protein